MFVSCERAPVEPEEPSSPTFTEIQADIFSQSCARSGCHVGDNAPQGLDLSAGNAYANLVEVASNQVPDLQRVDPGNPDDSYLVIKLEGGDRMAGGTSQMPFGGPALSDEKIQQVRDWIAEGAPDN
jgi:mono/diheme cytochrome c family protein